MHKTILVTAMKTMNRSIIPITILIAAIFFGCSSKTSIPMTPANDSLTDLNLPACETQNRSNHSLAGLWLVSLDVPDLKMTCDEARTIMAHYDVTHFLPPPAITVHSYNPITCVADIDVKISNPTYIDGFDLRLIIYTDDRGVRLLNSDGWTNLWDIPGGSQINPFSAYAENWPFRRFAGNTNHTERLQIYLPKPSEPVLFGIDVSYPSNCMEPYSISNFEQEPLYDYSDSQALVHVKVLDHQSNVESVALYCPIITGQPYVYFSRFNNELWELNLVNNTGALEGEYRGFIMAFSGDSPGIYMLKEVSIKVNPSSSCPADNNNTWDTAESLILKDMRIGCVDQYDDDWFVIYTPPLGIESASIDLNITNDDNALMTLWASTPGNDAPGSLIAENHHIQLDQRIESRYLINIAGTGEFTEYELIVSFDHKIATVDCNIYVATDDGTETGTWPIWEEPDPDEELTIDHIRNLMTWTNNFWNQYGYHLNWDGTVTIMDSKYYFLNGQDWEMHELYGRYTGKTSLYFECSTGTAYCWVFYPPSDHSVGNVFTVYGPNVWYWEDVVSHEYGHGIGYLFDEYAYTSMGCDCGDNVCIGGVPWLFWVDDGCYYGNLMWYCIIGWTWDLYNMTNAQAQFINKFHFQNPNNFPWH